MNASRHAIIFAGGGTGGHIFPSIAIAERIRQRAADKAPECVFVVSDRPGDARILRARGERFVTLPARPFGARPRALAGFFWNWGSSVRAVRAEIRRLRSEGAQRIDVVCTGGFVSAPAARAAVAERTPYTLVNLDAVPGRANSLIARRASRVFTVEGSDAPAGWSRIPPIVRDEAISALSPEQARQALGLDPALPTLLVVGGSQGARTINDAILALLSESPELFTGWQVIHLTGESRTADIRAAYSGAVEAARVEEFLREMGMAWRAATLAISRCGAGAVGEAWASGTPCVFLPYPFHRDDHQRANAQALERVGGAIVLTDHVDAGANAQALRPALESLLRDPQQADRMRGALASLGAADGADRVAWAMMKTVPDNP